MHERSPGWVRIGNALALLALIAMGAVLTLIIVGSLWLIGQMT